MPEFIVAHIVKVTKTSRPVTAWIREDSDPNKREFATRFESVLLAYDYAHSLGIADSAIRIQEV